MTVVKGDKLAARCTMVSERNRITKIGSTNEDEMCNFYMMYWTKGNSLKNKYCFSSGPPFYYWNRSSNPSLNNIPDTEASSI